MRKERSYAPSEIAFLGCGGTNVDDATKEMKRLIDESEDPRHAIFFVMIAFLMSTAPVDSLRTTQ